MDDRLIQQLLADHSRTPRNYGTIEDAHVESHVDNPRCVGPTHPEGDQVTVTAALSEETPRVVEAVGFTGRGCTLSQAAASLLTERMVGTPVEDVVEWDGETLEELVFQELRQPLHDFVVGIRNG